MSPRYAYECPKCLKDHDVVNPSVLSRRSKHVLSVMRS